VESSNFATGWRAPHANIAAWRHQFLRTISRVTREAAPSIATLHLTATNELGLP